MIIGNRQSALISSHAYDSMQLCKQTYKIDARFVWSVINTLLLGSHQIKSLTEPTLTASVQCDN